MKKGKTSKLTGYNNIKAFYGTVDSLKLKSIYLNIQTWVEPKKDIDNWSRVVLNLSRNIKHSIFNKINQTFFNDKFIVDLDLRSSGINVDKKSFMNLEINFYIKDGVDINFKDTEVKETLKDITNKILQDNFKKNNYFNFYLTKNNNNLTETVKTENI